MLSQLRAHGYIAATVKMSLEGGGLLELELGQAPPEEMSPMERRVVEGKPVRSPIAERALRSLGLSDKG
jgi:hypothetical protein